MQTLFEWGSILGLILPPAAIVAGACATLGPSFVYWRSHAGERGVASRRAVALDHPVSAVRLPEIRQQQPFGRTP